MASHKLKVSPTSWPVQKKIRRFHPNKQKIIQMEIDKLLIAKFVREFKYPNWLVKMVVVPKKKRRWWVYVDYTNLNDACPNDNFLLPRIDQIVDATTRHGMLSFLNVFSKYHKIPMFQLDEEKTVFVTTQGLYCYRVMLFGLKNVSTTY